MNKVKSFKEFIGESIWSDIQDRSAGEAERKEDDVNLLDRDGFYDYLKKRYSKLSHIISKDPSEIHITLGWSYIPKRDYKIDIHWVEQNKIKNLYLNFGQCELDNLCRKNFKIGTDNDGISNKEIISIIDFCLDYIKSQKYIESPINESIWSGIQDRSAGDVRRREDGIKVHTCIDVDIYLKNVSDPYYDEFIKEILNYNDSYVDYRVAILNIRDKAYSTEEMKNIRAFEAPYAYLIYDGGHGTDLIAEFWTYDEMKDFDLDDFEDRVIEDDYISICKGIATKLKEVGGDIEYLPRNKSGIIKSTYQKHNESDYEGDYVLQLISESDVNDWEIKYVDQYGEGSTSTCLYDFRESMIDTFPELDDVDFITWSYNNYACNIGIPITAVTVKNFNKYKEYTKNWFTVDEEVE